MSMLRLTAVIQREADLYVALCPEMDVASQGSTVEEARSNLIKALELFLEHGDTEEIKARTKSDVFITSVEVAVA